MLWVLAVVLVAQAVSSADPLGPGNGPWVVETPEEHGMRTADLEKSADFIANAVRTRTCFLVAKDGALVFEKYYGSRTVDTTAQGFSMTKTIGSMLALAAATHDGLDLDADITAKYGISSPKPYPVTVRQILSSTLDGSFPGEKWRYDTVGNLWINKIPQVVMALTGRSIEDYFNQRLRGPMGLSTQFKWDSYTQWATGTHGTCRDYLRFSQLMNNRGRWAGQAKPLIAEHFMMDQGRPWKFDAPDYSSTCYGLLTWINSDSTTYPGTCKGILTTYQRSEPWCTGLGKEPLLCGSGLNGQEMTSMPDRNIGLMSMGTTLLPPSGYKNYVRAIMAGFCPSIGMECGYPWQGDNTTVAKPH